MDTGVANPLVVLTTLADALSARDLVRRLVDARVVACGSIVPGVRSIYRWEGTIEDSEEVLVLLKTRADRWDALQSAVADWHPYEVPELLAVPVTAGLDAYVAWVHRAAAPEDAA